MENRFTYILFVFAVHDDPDSFVGTIAEEISMIAMSPDVRYFYGPQSAVFTFSSQETFHNMSEILSIMFGQEKLTYMFLPLDKNKMSSGFGENVDKHLFGSTPLVVIPTNISQINKINEMIEKLKDEDFEDEDEDDDEILKLKCQPQEPSVNDILDKIKDKGIKSLTNKEKTILDNYAKQL